MTDVEPTYRLVAGTVVYRKVQRSMRSGGVRMEWMRMSVPPDARTGKPSKYKAIYAVGKLPVPNEPIDPSRAHHMQADSLAWWSDLLRKEGLT